MRGLFWGLVEPIRGRLLSGSDRPLEVFRANAVAGASAGAIAAALTTPFDVAKTRMQLYHVGSGHAAGAVTTFSVLGGMMKEKGLACLFKGWSARAWKAMIACSTVLSSYEMLKRF